MSVVRITADKPVRYSLDNGVTQTEYAPGEVYQVPDWVAAAFAKRNWAKQLTSDDLDKLAAEDQAKGDDKDTDGGDGPEVDLSALRPVDRRRKPKED